MMYHNISKFFFIVCMAISGTQAKTSQTTNGVPMTTAPSSPGMTGNQSTSSNTSLTSQTPYTTNITTQNSTYRPQGDAVRRFTMPTLPPMPSFPIYSAPQPGMQRRPTVNPEKILIDELFANYTSWARPVTNPRSTVHVKVNYMLFSIEDLNERDETFSSYGWITMDWQDQFLGWSEASHDIQKLSTIPSSAVWTPPLICHNRRASKEATQELLGPIRKLPLTIRSSGVVSYEDVGSITTDCNVNMYTFPFDSQTCTVEFGSIDQINASCLQSGKAFTDASMKRFFPDDQWRLTDAKCNNVINPVYFNNEVVLEYTFARKPMFYLNTIIAPCVVVALLVGLVFALPVEAGEKVSLGITLLLTFAVFLLLVGDFMPQSSDVTPLLTIYLDVSLIISGLSVVFTVVVLNIHHSPNPGRPPACLRACTGGHKDKSAKNKYPLDDENGLLGGGVGVEGMSLKLTGQTETGDAGLRDCVRRLEDLVRRVEGRLDGQREGDQARGEWAAVARVCDRVLLVIFVIITILTSILLLGWAPFKML